MKKRGFTLIEALAVIVILALITVIAIPTITRLVDNTKKESFVTSVHNLMESFESLNNEAYLEGKKYESLIVTSKLLPVTVNSFESGQVLYDQNEEVKVEFVSNGLFCASGTSDNLQVSKGSCAQLDNSEPIIDDISIVSTSGTIRLVITAHDPESGIKNIAYSIDGSDFISISNDHTIRGLDEGTTYNLVIRVTNGKDMYVDEAKTVITRSLAVPTLTVAPTGWQQSKTVTINFPEGNYIYSYNKDGYGWVTTKNKVEEIEFTENGYIIASVSDGVNKLESSTLNVSLIDNDEPICSIVVADLGKWKTSKTLTISATDTTSGVYGIKLPGGSTYVAGDTTTYVATSSGVYTATVMDNAGRTSNCQVNATRIDSTAPKNVVIAMQSRTETSIVVEAQAVDNESGIVKYEYKIDNGAYQNGGPTNTYIFSGIGTGSHTVRVRVTNGVGLTTESTELTITTVSVTAPTFVVSTEDWAKSKEVAIIYPPKLSKYTYQYRVNGGSWQNVDGVTKTVEFTSPGKLEAQVLVNGIAPVTPEVYNVTKIDNTPPTKPTYEAKYVANNGGYTSGTWTNSEVYTKVTSTDAGIGVSKIEYSMDQINWSTFSFGRSGGLKKNGTTYSGEEVWSLLNRDNTYYFRATDSLGNVSEVSDAYTIRYDLTAPSCSVAGPYSDSSLNSSITYAKNGTTVYYAVSCTDANGMSNGVAANEVNRSNTTRLTGVELVNTQSITNGQKYIFGVTVGTGDGTANISIPAGVAADSVGNTNTTAITSSNITLDNTKPSCTWSGPSSSSIVVGDSTSFTLTCSDAIGITAGYYSTNIKDYMTATDGLSITSVSRTGGSTSYVYTVNVKAETGVGTRQVSLNAGTLGDTAGNYNDAATSGNLTVNYAAVTGVGLFDSSVWWNYSSSTKGKWTMTYSYQREGANVKYKFYWRAWLTSGFYNDAFVIKAYLNSSEIDTWRVKYSQESGGNDWNWDKSATTGWYYVNNKTSGTVPFYAKMINKGGSYETGNTVMATSSTYNLVVPAY